MDDGPRGKETAEEAPLSERRPYRIDAALLRGDLVVFALLALDLAFALAVRPHLPARVPMHWGADGKVNGWGTPWDAALSLPAIAAAVYAVLLVVPLIDPRRKSYALFDETLRVFRGAIVVFLLLVHALLLTNGLGTPVPMDRMARLLVPALFVVLGNRFGRVRHNWFFGIRVPWTLESEEVWTRTHRMAGKLWVAGGLLLAAAAFLPSGVGEPLFGAGIVGLVAAPVVYSYLLYRRIGGARS